MHVYRASLCILLLLLLGCDFSGSEPAAKISRPGSGCENNRHCTFANNIEVWLSETSLSPETPFTIYTKLPHNLIITEAKLAGVSMYMGYIPLQFRREDDVWLANTMVGVCAQKNMVWKLVLTTGDKSTSANQTIEYYFNVTY